MGQVTLTCTICGYEKTEEIAALGHSSICTDNGDGTHDYVCVTCGTVEVDNEAHINVDGVCSSCGATEPSDPISDSTLKFKSVSLTLESDISMNFYVRNTVLEGWEDPYVVFTKALYDTVGNITGYESETVNIFELKADSSGVACHAFRFAGVTSREMGSLVTATLYASKEGQLYVGATVEYSVLKYATNMLSKVTDNSLKTLLVDLLNYGAASQVYFGCNTANLVNANLTEEQKVYATETAPTVESCTELIKNDGATVSFKTVSLMLEDKVTINYYLNLTNYTGDVNDLELHVRYKDAYGNENTAVIDSSEFEYKLYNGAYYYMANFSALYAFQMREICTAEAFSKTTGERVSNTVVYSIESYVASKSSAADENLVALILAMMKYGDAAEAYFAK